MNVIFAIAWEGWKIQDFNGDLTRDLTRAYEMSHFGLKMAGLFFSGINLLFSIIAL